MQSSSSFNAVVQPSLKAKSYLRTSGLSKRAQSGLLTLSLVMVDILTIATAFRLAYFIRFETSINIFRLEVIPSIIYYQQLMIVLVPLLVGVFSILGLYNRANLMGGTREYSLLFNGTTFGMFLMIAAGFLIPDFIFARGWLLMSWGFAFLFSAVGRFTLRRVVYYLRQKGYFLSSAIIVGANQEGLLLAEQLLSWTTSGLHLLGFIEDNAPAGSPLFHHLPCLGPLDQLTDILKANQVDELILTTSALTRSEMLYIFKKYGVSSSVNLRLSSGLFEIITTGLQINELASVPLVRVNKARLTGMDRVLKLILDYGMTIPGLILLSPLFLFTALIVKLDSPGPIIHRRRVMGVNGRQFEAYKFRTMYENGDEILAAYPELQKELAQNHKLVDDPRITRAGKLLRKTSLDELPQLFNVLRREMSLVGPRMISPAEISKYNQWDINLLTVPPGITGLWQVSGRSDVSYEERVRLDMHYIRNWSIWFDLQLLIETIPAVLKGRGAY